MKRICIQITSDQYNLLKQKAGNGISVALLIRQAIDQAYKPQKDNNQ
nr:hypothetical protein [uncultured Mediterranean phage uvMED]BAR24860.1 hypothetical protein [uncultured Mediterranean phage uvMED]BAR24938.1 hypothetical protein [uncultured Mediterranean phage uvMED]BAR24960.1 hypothetical protein [uncultured Mediterranean phage uvMED]BAR39220.1 hypothetical protein [uncultured Mediterranean phage uvMED]